MVKFYGMKRERERENQRHILKVIYIPRKAYPMGMMVCVYVGPNTKVFLCTYEHEFKMSGDSLGVRGTEFKNVFT